MGVFAETRNGFECFYNCNIFCFPDLGKQFSTVVFWYSAMYVTKIIRINPDNVASRGAVGRTHIIVRFQTGNRRKDHGTANFVGFVYVLERFPQQELGLWVFMCTINIIPIFPFFPFCPRSPYFDYHAEGYHAPSIPHGPPRLYHHCTAITPVHIPATTPRATTPHTYHHGLSRLCIHPGYHT